MQCNVFVKHEGITLSEVRLEFKRNIHGVNVEKHEIITDSMGLFNIPDFPVNLSYICIPSNIFCE
jgi:hypothetical protein